jgi:uncharacterized membrane protein YcaP (DUF421 family)
MDLDWDRIFGVNTSLLELIVRGTVMYLFLFLMFRVVIRRRVGAVGMADILIMVIVADAAQNAMSGEYKTVTEGFVLVATIFAWNYTFDWLNYHVPALQEWLEPPPLLLIQNGRLLHRNLRHEFITEDELKSKLREHGVSDYAQVQTAHMESDGTVSVIKRRDRSSRRAHQG